MSRKSLSSKEVSIDEQAFEREEREDEGDEYVVDETPEFRATVEMEIQAKVDANHPEGIVDTSEDRIYGVTLAQEERIRAREEELERISAQAVFGKQQGRAWRTRQHVEEMDWRRDPPREADPREHLEVEELAAVNRHAQRLADDVSGGYTRAVIAKRLASRVRDGMGMFEAVMATKEELLHESGTIVPIGRLEEIRRGEVSVEGEILELWNPSSPAIQQVGCSKTRRGERSSPSGRRASNRWFARVSASSSGRRRRTGTTAGARSR